MDVRFLPQPRRATPALGAELKAVPEHAKLSSASAFLDDPPPAPPAGPVRRSVSGHPSSGRPESQPLSGMPSAVGSGRGRTYSFGRLGSGPGARGSLGRTSLMQRGRQLVDLGKLQASAVQAPTPEPHAVCHGRGMAWAWNLHTRAVSAACMQLPPPPTHTAACIALHCHCGLPWRFMRMRMHRPGVPNCTLTAHPCTHA